MNITIGDIPLFLSIGTNIAPSFIVAIIDIMLSNDLFTNIATLSCFFMFKLFFI